MFTKMHLCHRVYVVTHCVGFKCPIFKQGTSTCCIIVYRAGGKQVFLLCPIAKTGRERTTFQSESRAFTRTSGHIGRFPLYSCSGNKQKKLNFSFTFNDNGKQDRWRKWMQTAAKPTGLSNNTIMFALRYSLKSLNRSADHKFIFQSHLLHFFTGTANKPLLYCV